MPAGADRYLLRHETADRTHYEKLHPAEMSFENRMRCLRDLKDIGFQTGCGFMVGSPFQTPETLAEDLKFIETFRPAMCGIGPFIPQKDTPFGDRPAGTAEQTVYLLSLLRLMQPKLLLPATTALGTILPDGRERGLAAGANVVMPNLSAAFRAKKIRTLRRQAVHRRGGGAVHRLPVAACAVGRREYRHRPRRRKIVKSVPNKKGYNINGCL